MASAAACSVSSSGISSSSLWGSGIQELVREQRVASGRSSAARAPGCSAQSVPLQWQQSDAARDAAVRMAEERLKAGMTAANLSSKEVMDADKKYFVPTYARAPLVFVSGQGCWLTDAEGKEYLDMTAGIAVNSLGHGDDTWVKAVAEQAATLTHVSNLYHSIPQVGLHLHLELQLQIPRHCVDET